MESFDDLVIDKIKLLHFLVLKYLLRNPVSMILNIKLVFENKITWKGYIGLTFEVVVYLTPKNVVH